jgi:recombination protein RecT
MMTETVSAAVERVGGAYSMIEAQAAEFAKVLPAHVGQEKFARWALTCLRNRDIAEVMETSPGQLSVMSALMDCASLGLEPGRTYHLVAFGGKEKDGTPKPKTVTGMTDYKGEIELIYRAARTPVVVRLVHKLDLYAPRGANVPPNHDVPDEIGWFGDRGPVIGGYAYTEMSPGMYSMVIQMNETEFLRHKAKARAQNVWEEWPEAMRLKTLVHSLRKFVPWSAEWLPS